MGDSLGIDHTIDYRNHDPVKAILELTDGRGVDASIEALGTQGTFEAALRVLRPGGTLSSLGVYSTDLRIPLDAFAAGLGDTRIVTTLGYGFAWHPPGTTDPAGLHQAIHHVNLAHGAGVDVLRAHAPLASVGAIHNMQPARPVARTPADDAAAALLDEYWNKAFPEAQILGHYPPALARAIEPYVQAGDMDRICRKPDWFGVNHYSPVYARADAKAPLGFAWADAPPGVPRSPIG